VGLPLLSILRSCNHRVRNRQGLTFLGLFRLHGSETFLHGLASKNVMSYHVGYSLHFSKFLNQRASLQGPLNLASGPGPTALAGPAGA
jgi:hypothetical protein